MDWTKVPYYILDLIQQAPAVDVPGLGRFEAVLHPAYIDLPAKEAQPPRLEARFSQEEAGDRDLLGAYIVFAAGVSESEAHEAILMFADEVARHTRNGQPFAVPHFGTFHRTPEDKIRFQPDWDAFNLSFNGLQPVPIPVGAVAPEAEAEWPDVSSLPDVEKDKPDIPGLSSAPGAFAPEGIPGVQAGNDEVPDVSTRMWWGILVSAIVLITILCAYLAWDIISHRDQLQRLPVLPPAVIADTMDTAATQSPEPVTPEDGSQGSDSAGAAVDTSTRQPDTGREPCYVVVGAFSDTANVLRMESRLAEMGYPAERLPGRTITRVAIRASCDPVALQNILEDARARIHPQAWIY